MTQNNEITDFKVAVKDSVEFVDIEDGTYPAVCARLSLEVNIPDGKGGTFDKINWMFTVEGKEVRGQSSVIMSPKSKAYAWVKAITGKELPINTDFSPSMVTGKNCQVLIEHKEQEKKFNGEVTKVNYPQVTKVLSAKKK